MISRLWSLWSRVIVLAFAPAILVHELAHIIVGKRWSDNFRMTWRPLHGERPVIRFEYPPDIEHWKIVLANIAPALLGVALAPIAFVVVSRRGVIDPIGAYVALSWLAIALPSGDDLAPLLRARPRSP